MRRAVLDGVLKKLKARQTDVVKRNMVGRSRVGQRHGGGPQIM